MSKPKDKPGDRNNFTIIPNLVLLRCDPWQLALWLTIKSIARDDGECFLSTPDLAKLAQMSAGKCSTVRQELISMGFLSGEMRRDPGFSQSVWHLRIPDLWERNTEWVKNNPTYRDKMSFVESLHQMKPSPDERGVTPHERGLSPDETIKIKEVDLNNKRNVDAWAFVIAQLHSEMDKSTFDDRVGESMFVSFENGVFVARCNDPDWVAARLTSKIEGVLAGYVGDVELKLEQATRR
jgi:hypothetical protein